MKEFFEVCDAWNGISWHIPSYLSNIENIGNIDSVVITDKVGELV